MSAGSARLPAREEWWWRDAPPAWRSPVCLRSRLLRFTGAKTPLQRTREGCGHEGDDDHCADHGDGTYEAADVAARVPAARRVTLSQFDGGQSGKKTMQLRVRGTQDADRIRTCRRSLRW
jgi:hypothetical protein